MKYRLTGPAELHHMQNLEYFAFINDPVADKYELGLIKAIKKCAARPEAFNKRKQIRGYDIRRAYHPHFRSIAFDYSIVDTHIVVWCLIDTRMSEKTQTQRLNIGLDSDSL